MRKWISAVGIAAAVGLASASSVTPVKAAAPTPIAQANNLLLGWTDPFAGASAGFQRHGLIGAVSGFVVGTVVGIPARYTDGLVFDNLPPVGSPVVRAP